MDQKIRQITFILKKRTGLLGLWPFCEALVVNHGNKAMRHWETEITLIRVIFFSFGEKIVIFRRIFFQRKIFHSAVNGLFFVLKLPTTGILYCRAFSTLSNTNVWVPPRLNCKNWRVRIPLSANISLVFRYS